MFTDFIDGSVHIFAKKKQKWWSHTKEHAIYGPGLRFVICFTDENGTVSDRHESNSRRISDQDEVRPV